MLLFGILSINTYITNIIIYYQGTLSTQWRPTLCWCSCYRSRTPLVSCLVVVREMMSLLFRNLNLLIFMNFIIYYSGTLSRRWPPTLCWCSCYRSRTPPVSCLIIVREMMSLLFRNLNLLICFIIYYSGTLSRRWQPTLCLGSCSRSRTDTTATSWSTRRDTSFT